VQKAVEDLGIGGSVDSIHLLIRTGEPVFIIKIRYKEATGKSILGELARVEERQKGLRISLENEFDLADALRALWTAYGRSKVEQAGRTEIFVTGADPAEIKRVRVRDKEIDMAGKINELAMRVIPEGFRVRSVRRSQGETTFIAAEDPIREEWREMAAKLGAGE